MFFFFFFTEKKIALPKWKLECSESLSRLVAVTWFSAALSVTPQLLLSDNWYSQDWQQNPARKLHYA
jgi:hypothetical protein